MLGPRSQRPSEPQVVIWTALASPCATTSRRSASIMARDPLAVQHGTPSGFCWSQT
jgi:hypothetical protein